MPIDKILSRAYSSRMKTALNRKENPVMLNHARGPLVSRPVPIVVPPPDPAVVERREAAVGEQREQLQDRYLLHRKNHVQRLDGRGVKLPEVPEFLKRRGVRRVR